MSVGLPSHYQLRLEHISHEVSRLPPDARGTIVILGDCHVEGNPVKELAGAHVVNMGIKENALKSDCAAMKDRLWQMPLARPGHVVICAGLSDLRAKRSPLDVEQCYRQLIEGVRMTVPAAKIHIAFLPPTRQPHESLMHEVAVMNAILEELATSMNVEFVDLFSPLEDDNGELDVAFSLDGIHLNETGYEKVNEMLERHLISGASY